jgi:signal transduction histidine kinase
VNGDTHSERLQEELRALEAQKDLVMTTLSHDLQTQLAATLASAITLAKSGDELEPERRDRMLHGIIASMRRMRALVSDLLDHERLDRGLAEPEREATNVGALAQRIAEETGYVLERPLVVEAPDLTVDVDPIQTARILENLLMNAGRHTPPGTKVWLRLEAAGDGVAIAVEDDGPGVPPEMQAALADPESHGALAFDRPAATGVGLSLVARFAEAHGGRAWVEERPGGGASFRVLLPGRSAATPPA